MKRQFFAAAAIVALLAPAIALAGSGPSVRYSLTLKVQGPGTVAAAPGGKCVGYLTRGHQCRFVYTAGTSVKLTAWPKVNAKLASWTGGGVAGKAMAQRLKMTGPKVVTVRFITVTPPAPPAPPPPPAVGTRSNPVPLGQPVGIVMGDEHWRLRILSTQPDATAAVLAENMFNDPPATGHQFFIVSLQVDYVSGTKTEDPDFAITSDLRAVGPSNVVYTTFGSDSRCGVIPDSFTFKGDLLPGGSMTGNECWSVLSSEASSLIAFMDFSSGQYFMALR